MDVMDLKKFNVIDTLEILKKYYITDSKQMVTRWIRQNKIKATRSENRKEGWEINESDLYAFIDSLRPGLKQLFDENEHLKIENKKLKSMQKEATAEAIQEQLTFVDLDRIPNKKPHDKYGEIKPYLLRKIFFNSEELKYLSKEEQEYKYEQFYDLFFDNDQLKLQLFDPKTNQYICPYTRKRYDYPRPLIKNAAKEFLIPKLF